MRPRWLGLISLAFCALCSWCPAIAATEGIPTAVLGLEAIDAPAAVVDEVTEQLRQRVSAAPDLRRVAGKDLIELKLVFSCADEGHACMAQAGKSLDAEKLIFGSVKRSGRDFAIWLKLFDVRKEKVDSWVTDTLPGAQSDQAGIHVASGRWFAKLTGRPLNAGTIQVSANLYGALVTVDGIPAGTTGEQPLTLPEVKPGKHEVIATKAGHSRASQQFIVPPGQTVVVNLTLRPTSETDATTTTTTPPPVAVRRSLEGQEGQKGQKEDGERAGSDAGSGDGRGGYRTGFWVTLGASLVSAGAAVKFGLDVLKVNKDLDVFRRYHCGPTLEQICDPSGRQAPLSDTEVSQRDAKVKEGEHDRNLQWVFIGVGSALGITSAYLLYKGYLDSDETAVHHEAHRGLRIFPTAGVSSGGVLAEFDF